MIRCLYIIKSDGEPLYGRTFEEDSYIDLKAIPSIVRNSVVLFQSSSSTSSERVYTLEQDHCLWAYAFFHSFAIVAQSNDSGHINALKNTLLSFGRTLSRQYVQIIDSWCGSMSEIVDINELIDSYFSMKMSTLTRKKLASIDKLLYSIMEQPEISFVGVFDSNGHMLSGNVPESHLFRLEIEISQGSVRPIMDIVPTSVTSGDHKVQLLRVHSFTVAVAADPSESTLHAISAAGELAHSLNEML
ncbi:MAG: hypothetical protein JW779_11650 [Candidatus Thorarchaeota archaeon]|nr:hypothetical protein [Candidatus Thorarchaeota archaeon]